MCSLPDQHVRATYELWGSYGLTGNPDVLTRLRGRSPRSFADYAHRALP